MGKNAIIILFFLYFSNQTPAYAAYTVGWQRYSAAKERRWLMRDDTSQAGGFKCLVIRFS